MRRLPVYFLIDVSESMCGPVHEQVQKAIQSVVADLRTDPQALETVHVAVVAFAGKARTLASLADLTVFTPPTLPLGGGTALGRGLLHLFQQLDRDLHKPSATQKGDWKPLIFLFTDGHPTDDVSAAHKAWISTYRKNCRMVAVSFGGEADHAVLNRFTEEIVAFDPAASGAFSRFAMWVSRSIGITSTAVERGAEVSIRQDKSLSKEGPIQFVDVGRPQESQLDQRNVFLIGKCSATKRPYALKYKRGSAGQPYQFDFGCPLPEDYFELTEGDGSVQVSTHQLAGVGRCPICEHGCALCKCRCGKLTCGDLGGGAVTCPWCKHRDNYVPAHFDVRRGLG